MRVFLSNWTHVCTGVAASAALSALAACGGGGAASSTPSAGTPTTPVITQSTITLPSSVQVVSAK